jgi:RNA polymerase primary sigma factor
MKISKLITIQDSDNLNRYFAEIRNYPTYTKEEEKVLLRKIQNKGDIGALDLLIKANTRFVVSVAKKYQGQGVPLLDLISEGNAGLIEASKRFDLTKDLKFFSYAVWWIRIKIFASMDFNKRLIQLPANREMLVQKVKREIALLEQSLGHLPSIHQLYDHFDGEVSRSDLYEAIVHGGVVKSISEAIGDEDSLTLEEVTAGDIDIDDINKAQSVFVDLNRFLYHLTQFEYDVLVLAMGLNGESPIRAKDIAKSLSLKEKDINNIRTRALKRLRKLKHITSLKDYF